MLHRRGFLRSILGLPLLALGAVACAPKEPKKAEGVEQVSYVLHIRLDTSCVDPVIQNTYWYVAALPKG